ncbi:MAG TPA: DUF6183 family protein [Acidimicrobiia bacterium]
MINQRTVDAIEASDTDELLRIVDGYCAVKDWDLLLSIRQRCQEALTRGKQLWGVDEHIRYRLALEAPAKWAGPVVAEGRGRFTLGPLPEVAASRKTWAEMEPFLEHGPDRMTFAAERIIRRDGVDDVLELPDLQEWEPTYSVPIYKSDRIETPSPKLPPGKKVTLPGEFSIADDPISEQALNDLVEPWVTQSNGRSQTVTVDGTPLQAIAALGLREAHIVRLDPSQALAIMGWTASSGGAHGDRRGAAAGRYLAWWVVASLSDMDWPAPADDIGTAVNGLGWLWFDDNSPDSGWALRLAVGDPDSGLAWAISASDLAD